MKLKISGGDVKTVQKDTGHSQSRMVMDVYSHSFDEDRKHLARKMDEHFFSPLQQTKKEEAPAQPPMNESMLKLMQMLQESPEKAASLMLLLGLN